MKNLMFILAFITPIIGFSQAPKHEVKGGKPKKFMNDWYKECRREKDPISLNGKRAFIKAIYQDSYTQDLDLVLNPSIYNPSGDTNIVSIEILQDNDHVYQKQSEFRKACIMSGFNKNYSIGQIRDYMVDAKHMGFLIRTTYKDHTVKAIYMKMHFNYALLNHQKGNFDVLVTKPLVDNYEYDDFEY